METNITSPVAGIVDSILVKEMQVSKSRGITNEIKRKVTWKI